MCVPYLSWYSHRNGFHLPLMKLIKPAEKARTKSRLTLFCIILSHF